MPQNFTLHTLYDCAVFSQEICVTQYPSSNAAMKTRNHGKEVSVNSICCTTSQRTQSAFIKKCNRLELYEKIMAYHYLSTLIHKMQRF